LKFENEMYQEVYSEYKAQKANDDSKKDLVRRVLDGGKKFVVNYNPIVGLLPVKTQENLRDKNKKLFGSLDTNVATMASAIGLGLGAYFIGLNLDGFDIGFEMMQKIRVGWAYAGEAPKYISFPFIWGGFSKTVTDAISYYLIADSAIRAGAALCGKPLGCLIGEAASYITGKVSQRTKSMKDKQESLLRDEEMIHNAKDFTENKRKREEDNIAKLTKEIWNSNKAGNYEDEKRLRLELESLLNKA